MLHLVPSGREALPPPPAGARVPPPPHPVETPDIHVTLPDGAQGRLPGALWPTAKAHQTAVPPAGDPLALAVAQVLPQRGQRAL